MERNKPDWWAQNPGVGVGLAAVIFLQRMGWGLSGVLLQRLADEGKRPVLIGAGRVQPDFVGILTGGLDTNI